MVATLLRSIVEQPDAGQVQAQHARVVEQLLGRFDDSAALLVEAEVDILAFSLFPKEPRRQIWSNNPVRHEAPTDRVGGRSPPASCRSSPLSRRQPNREAPVRARAASTTTGQVGTATGLDPASKTEGCTNAKTSGGTP